MSSKQKNMANAIRALAMDAVQQANSGHPGMPMGMAEIAVGLWGTHLKHNPKNPLWMNRDRFVLQTVMALCCFMHYFTWRVTTCRCKS